MNAPTTEHGHQIVFDPAGAPLYALVPWNEYEEIFDGRPDEEVVIPHDVARAHLLDGVSLIRAWRERLGLTQREVAERMGVSQAAFAKLESRNARPRTATLRRVAAALGVEWEQIRG